MVSTPSRRRIEAALTTGLSRAFADSLDLDAALAAVHPNAHRWDYLLGHKPSGQLIGVEPHSAKEDEVGAVIKKRKAALEQLRLHLKDGTRVAAWLWVASRKVHKFVGTDFCGDQRRGM